MRAEVPGKGGRVPVPGSGVPLWGWRKEEDARGTIGSPLSKETFPRSVVPSRPSVEGVWPVSQKSKLEGKKNSERRVHS